MTPDETSEPGPILHLQKITGIGGSERFLIQLGGGLTDRGWDCHFGLLHPPEHRAARFVLEKAGWTVHPIPLDGRVSWGTVRSLRELLDELEPTLLHTHLIHGDLHGWLASIGLDVTRVTTKHNDDWFKRLPGYGPFARLLNRGFDRGVVISDHLMDVYRNRLSVSTPSFRRIHYGLDPEEFLDRDEQKELSPPAGSLDLPDDVGVCFGMVARLVEQKGHRDLLEAFERVHEIHDDAHLVLVGSGTLRMDLDGLVEDKGLDDAVTFTGFRWDVPSLLQRFDVFVHPSRWEGFGLVFLEAMAARLPVVATQVGAIPEIVVDGETGYLSPPENPDALAENMIDLVRNPDRAKQFGEAGYERLRDQFSIERMIEAHEQLYRELLEDDSGE